MGKSAFDQIKTCVVAPGPIAGEPEISLSNSFAVLQAIAANPDSINLRSSTHLLDLESRLFDRQTRHMDYGVGSSSGMKTFGALNITQGPGA